MIPYRLRAAYIEGMFLGGDPVGGVELSSAWGDRRSQNLTFEKWLRALWNWPAFAEFLLMIRFMPITCPPFKD